MLNVSNLAIFGHFGINAYVVYNYYMRMKFTYELVVRIHGLVRTSTIFEKKIENVLLLTKGFFYNFFLVFFVFLRRFWFFDLNTF